MSFFDIPDLEPGCLWVHGGGVKEFKSTFLLNWILHTLVERHQDVYVRALEHEYRIQSLLEQMHAEKFDGNVAEAKIDLSTNRSFGRLHGIQDEDRVPQNVGNALFVFDVPLGPRNGIRKFKDIAHRYDVPVLFSTQLSRAAQERGRSHGGYSLNDFSVSVTREADRVSSSHYVESPGGPPRMVLNWLKDRRRSFEGLERGVDLGAEILFPSRAFKFPEPPDQTPPMSRFTVIENFSG